MTNKLKVTELFSGIGSQVAALKRLGVNFETVGISEIDKYAVKSYEAMNGETRNYGDITKVERLDYTDLLIFSSPCQDFSMAGKQAGLYNEKGEKTRSGLLLEVARLLMRMNDEHIQPKYLLMENVKNLVGKKFKPAFDIWLKALDALGYNNYWKVLNAKDYGVPQNRERVFVVSIRKDIDIDGYTFPEPFKLEKRLKDVLETNVDESFYLRKELVDRFIERLKNREISNTVRCGGAGSTDVKHTWDLVAEPQIKQVGNCFPTKTRDNPNQGRVYDAKGLSPALDCMGGGNREPKIIQNPHGYNNGGVKDIAPALTSGGNYTQNNFVIGSTQKNAYVGSLDDYSPCLTEAMGMGGGQIPMVSVEAFNTCKDGTAQALTAHLHKETVNDCTKLDRHSPATGVMEIGIGHHPFSKKFEFDGFHDDKPVPTLLASDYKAPKYYSDGVRIRKLTPKECWRLMDFTDEEFEAAQKAGVSKTQLYKQAGNSIVVSCLGHIFENLLKGTEFEPQGGFKQEWKDALKLASTKTAENGE